MNRSKLRIMVFALVMWAPAAAAMDEYRLDDGVKEMGIGIQSTGSNSIAWLNHFTVLPGFDTLTGVRLAFGGSVAAGNNIPNGTPVTVYLWGDFNQDGDPSDAFVIASINDVVAGTGLNTPTLYTFQTPVTLPVGDSFFAGAIISYSGQLLVASLDRDGTDSIPVYPPNFHSWIAGSANGTAVDPNALNLAQIPVDLVAQAIFGGTDDGTWIVRLDAVSSTGTPALTLAPPDLDFGEVDKGAISPNQSLVLLNSGTAILNVTQILLPPPPFVEAPGRICPPTPFPLAPGASCSIDYAFAPDASGPVAATLAIDSNDPASPHSVDLRGVGTIFDDGFE